MLERMLDWPVLSWLHFFDVMDWWKWPLAILLGGAFMAFFYGCILAINYSIDRIQEMWNEIWDDDDPNAGR